MKYKWIGLVLLIIASCNQAQAEPTLYTCYPDSLGESQPHNIMVVEPETGEFLLFDGVGKFINTGHWVGNRAMPDPTKHFTTKINNISLFFNKVDAGESIVWTLVFFKEGYDPAKSYCL